MSDGLFICIGIIIVIIVVFIISVIFSYFEERACWNSLRGNIHPDMTFEQFESYFNVDPSKWELNEYNVAYLLENKHGGWCTVKRNIDFTTFKDYKKYHEWKVKREKEKDKQILLENEMEVLQDIEKNIKRRVEREVKKDGNS